MSILFYTYIIHILGWKVSEGYTKRKYIYEEAAGYFIALRTDVSEFECGSAITPEQYSSIKEAIDAGYDALNFSSLLIMESKDKDILQEGNEFVEKIKELEWLENFFSNPDKIIF